VKDGESQLCARTYSKAKTERHVADGVNASVNSGVPYVNQISQLGHHRTVHHPDRESQPRVRYDQVIDTSR